MESRQKITPFLWFNDNAEEAARFYTSIFADAKILSTMPGPEGKAMSVTFELMGQRITILNGGPHFQINEAFSLFVDCADQAEVDFLWEKLCADGGEPGQCAWLKDKFGLSWQIVPRQLGEMLSDPDPEKSQRVLQAMLQMGKIDIAALRAAYDGA
ncbi:MAG: VOC family protein [Caldilineaceae bacterium]